MAAVTIGWLREKLSAIRIICILPDWPSWAKAARQTPAFGGTCRLAAVPLADNVL